MGIIGWILWIIVGFFVVCFAIKIATRNNKEEDYFESRMGMVGKVWDACCRKTKGEYGI